MLDGHLPCGTGSLGPGVGNVSLSLRDSVPLMRPAPQLNTAISTRVQNSTTSDAASNSQDGWF